MTAEKFFWVNIYPDGCYQPRNTQEECDQTAGGDRVARIRVTYFEGQFDSDKKEGGGE